MKIINFVLFFLFISIAVKAQTTHTDPTKMGYVLTDKDTIFNDTIQLEEIVLFKGKVDEESKNNLNC